MGYLFDEKKFVSENVLLHNNRMVSQYSRFLDSTPTFVTYYNVSNIESTVDYGFKNIEKLLGDTSPLRFNKVVGLPIYGIENIVPQLEDNEEGINMSFDGEGVILPNTVKPKPNDLFIIDILDKRIVFMVTNLSPDGLRDSGYYNISFTLKWINGDKIKDLERQTTDSFTCYVDNIGTEEKVLIRTQDIETLNLLNKVTTDISEYYLILFYDRKYNSFLLNQPNGTRLYDRLLTQFINKNKIFFNRRDYETLHLSIEDPSRLLAVEYHNSIFRAIEEQDPSLIKPVYYGDGYINDMSSIFYHWRDNTIRSTFFNLGPNPYIRPEILEVFKDAKEFFKHVEEETKKEDEGIVNISIPVGDGDVFTTDAGYKKRTTSEETSVIEPPIEPEVKKSKLSIDDLADVMNAPKVDEDLTIYTHHKSDIDEKNIVEKNEKYTIEVTNVKDILIKHSYKVPEGEDIMTKTITMYLSNNEPSLSALDLEDLLNYVEYMKPNHESFVLVPILLFILESYYKGYIKNTN